MKYIGYDLVISEEKLVLDKEITLKKLEWNKGDYLQITENDGQIELVRVDPLIKFLRGYKNDKTDGEIPAATSTIK